MAADYEKMVRDAYASIGRTGIGAAPNQIDPEGFAYWTQRAAKENLGPADLSGLFGSAVTNYFVEKPEDVYTDYVSDFLVRDAYDDIGREDIGSQPNNIDQQGYDYWRDQLTTGQLPVSQFEGTFNSAVKNAITSPQSQTPAPIKDHVTDYLRNSPLPDAPVKFLSRTPDMLAPRGGLGTPSAPAPRDDRGLMQVGGTGQESSFYSNGPYQSELIKSLRASSPGVPTQNGGVSMLPSGQTFGDGSNWLDSITRPTGLSNNVPRLGAPAAPSPELPPILPNVPGAMNPGQIEQGLMEVVPYWTATGGL